MLLLRQAALPQKSMVVFNSAASAKSGLSLKFLYFSKSRVAPMHPTTIPRLEFWGTVLLSELITEVNLKD
ncbi:unnamed protein product [Macrosiphum euphorbiae]|uniref:Uncharacterized protein n=1 Tax=Macrosiphum euphorbiae TaxID=13131 RepID=A0AAV0WID4_9HEMI|nr:unnamed protein product [Macrosiphum euphorbiae]